MRDLVYSFINDNLVTGFKLTDSLPWSKDGAPLYHKNKKTIYVDRPNTTQEPLFDTLDGMSAVEEITTVSVYVVTDAKTLPSNYEALVSAIQGGRVDATLTAGYTQRQTPVSTEYEDDTLVTQFDFTFSKFTC